MVYKGFRPFKTHNEYLMSSTQPETFGDGVHFGQLRIKFEWAPCDKLTVVAQQVENTKGERTFRKWNPKKVNVPFG